VMMGLGIAGAIAVGLLVRHIFSGPEVEGRRPEQERTPRALVQPTISAGPQEAPTGAVPARRLPTRWVRMARPSMVEEEPEELSDARARYDDVRSRLAAAGGPDDPQAAPLLPEMEAAAARLRRAEAAHDRRAGQVLQTRWRR
jgi:hypothetical protein